MSPLLIKPHFRKGRIYEASLHKGTKSILAYKRLGGKWKTYMSLSFFLKGFVVHQFARKCEFLMGCMTCHKMELEAWMTCQHD